MVHSVMPGAWEMGHRCNFKIKLGWAIKKPFLIAIIGQLAVRSPFKNLAV